jgi:hypothetical protein
MAMWLLLLIAPAWADCVTVPTPDDLNGHLQAAETAYVDLEMTEADAAVDQALFSLPCVDELLPPDLAARYHRVLGLRLYGAGEEQQAMRAFAAAKQLEPNHVLSKDLVPTGHVLREQYDRLTALGQTRAVAEPRYGTFAFDGSLGIQRPVDRFTLFQQLDEEDAIIETRYLGPGDLLPDYERKPKFRAPIIASTGAGLVAAGALYAVALGAAANWKNSDFASEADLLDARRRVNTLAGVSIGVGSAALAGGGFALLWTER